jgi:hypothetical protein
VSLLGVRVIGPCDDDMRVLADRSLLHRKLLGRPAGERQIKCIGFECAQDCRAVAYFQSDLNFRMRAREGAEHLRRKIFGGTDDADRDMSAL